VIDWLRLRLPIDRLLDDHVARLREQLDVISAVSHQGELLWRASARRSIPTPVSSVSWGIKDRRLIISGSPPALNGTNNVFGERDARVSAREMIKFFSGRTGCDAPLALDLWDCTRMDVTLNYALLSDVEVSEALQCLAHAHAGKRGVTTISDTCYWNYGSDLRSGKAYAKGAQLAKLVSKKRAIAANDDLGLSQRLLRLEVSLLSRFWRHSREPWHAWTVDRLEEEHRRYFSPLIGTLEVSDMSGLLEQLQRVAPSPGLAQAAYRTWLEIREIGYALVRQRMGQSTLRKHAKILTDAGLTPADLMAGQMLPLRRRGIELGQPVHSWDELRLAA
jgi:II/X family phage/plasmid replication protein